MRPSNPETDLLQVLTKLLTGASESARMIGKEGSFCQTFDRAPDQLSEPILHFRHLRVDGARAFIAGKITEGFTGVAAFTTLESQGEGEEWLIRAEVFDTRSKMSFSGFLPVRETPARTYLPLTSTIEIDGIPAIHGVFKPDRKAAKELIRKHARRAKASAKD